MQSLWMLVASFLFSIMGVCVKLASDTYSTSEIVAYRGFVGMVMIYLLVRTQGYSLRTRMAGHHLWRGTVGVIALWLWFYSISRLSLAMAVTLNYMSPIWIAAILFGGAWLKGKQRTEWGLLAAIALGFIGVLLLLRPSMHADQMVGGIVALISGMLAALAYMQVRQMGLMGEPEYRVVFYFSLTCAVAGLLGTMINGLGYGIGYGLGQDSADSSLAVHSLNAGWHAHQLKDFLLLITIGLTAATAQFAMTRAYRLGNTLVTANLQYVGIVFSSVWDLLLWDDALSWMSWLGIAVILSSGLIATFYNARNKPVIAIDPIATE